MADSADEASEFEVELPTRKHSSLTRPVIAAARRAHPLLAPSGVDSAREFCPKRISFLIRNHPTQVVTEVCEHGVCLVFELARCGG